MRKGVNALEMVFAMFILIVVTLVIIRLFSKTVSENTLPDIKDFRNAYGYEQEINKCKTACRSYTEAGGCQDISAAVEFCQKKVKIDIDGDGQTGSKGHHGLIANVPYCEDGLYCFHVDDQCSCGSLSLDASQCLRIMEDYYQGQLGLPESTANQIILNAVQPGQCEKDPTKWKQKQFADGRIFTVVNLPDGSPLRADYWWTSAGYSNLKGGTTTTTTTTGSSSVPSVSCVVASSSSITCTWNCPNDISQSNTGLLAVSKINQVISLTTKTGSFTFTGLNSGTKYNVGLVCDQEGKLVASYSITIQ